MAITPTVLSSQLSLLTTEQSVPNVQASQGEVRNLLGRSPVMQASMGAVLATYNFPTDKMEASQFVLSTLVNSANELEVSQTSVLVAVLPRTQFRRARVWNFALDAHEIVVLRIGEEETLVYDLTTEKWFVWTSKDRGTWRAHLGQNWLGMDRANYLNGNTATNVVAGDDTNGTLWTLDPEQGIDDNANSGEPDQDFPRIVTAGVPLRMRNTVPLDAIYLSIRTADAEAGFNEITLEVSDDNGNTFQNVGTVTVGSQTDQEVAWRSLGYIRAPGRLFRITDRGATSVFYSLDARLRGADNAG